jgi:phosphoribosylformylglycinamidine cyclo-ligase
MQEKDAYAKAGVDSASEEAALQGMLRWINRTLEFGPTPVKMPIGAFANVMALDDRTGVAISTDSVGTKLLVAQQLAKYDTVGIDCIAMSVNDLICVGARPLALVDYIGVQHIDAAALEQIAKGLYEGARIAGISIPGGEIAQIGEIVRGHKGGYAFDLVGTGIGTVPLDRIITGKLARPGDAILGLRSSGLHSNGYTLARKVLLKPGGIKVDQHVAELGTTLGGALLEPTKIYVREVVEMISDGFPLHGLCNITGDGFLNLSRLEASVGCEITDLPEPQPIFGLIQKMGGLPDEEMFRVFNMGIGFCMIVPDNPTIITRAVEICRAHGSECLRIGTVIADEQRRVFLRNPPGGGLVGESGRFTKQ